MSDPDDRPSVFEDDLSPRTLALCLVVSLAIWGAAIWAVVWVGVAT